MHMMSAPPQNLFAQEDQALRHGIIIAHITFDFFKTDIINLVKNGVNNKINRLSETEDPNDKIDTDRLKKDLADWLKSKHRLSHDNMLLLCHIVAPGTTTLPQSSAIRQNKNEFLKSLFKAGKTTIKLQPPFIKGGSCQTILPITIHYMQRHIKSASNYHLFTQEDTIGLSMLSIAWKSLKINCIPWTAPSPQGTRGAPSRTVIYNTWTSFGAITVNQANQTLRPEEHHQVTLEGQQCQLMETDADASWVATDFPLQDIHKVLSRRMLPDDFHPPNFTETEETEYVMNTYSYVKSKFNLENQLDQLILIVAIVFSRLLPNLFIERPQKLDQSQLISEWSTHRYLSTLPWVPHKGKSTGNWATLMTMTATFLFALYDGLSPLQFYFIENGKMFGKPWTDRHSESNRSEPIIWSHKTILDQRGVTAINMIHLGMLRGSGSKLFSAPVFCEKYFLHQEKAVNDLHTKLTTLFQTLPSGPFEAVSYLVRQEQAWHITCGGQLVKPDSFLNAGPLSQTPSSSSIGSPQKRRKMANTNNRLQDSEEEMDVDWKGIYEWPDKDDHWFPGLKAKRDKVDHWRVCLKTR
jgi:hypothetical protein